MSVIVEYQNKLVEKCQSSYFAEFCRNSLIFRHLDDVIFALLLLVLITSTFLGTGATGFFAFLILPLTLIKLLTKSGEKIEFTKIDLWIIVYFLFVILSLCASTLLVNSFKGFLKTALYIGFYFSINSFFKDNKNRIMPIFLTIACLCSFEAIVGILQNHAGVSEISGWQDTQNLEVHEILSRCYGTIKPFNPNLFAGYLVASISSIFAILSFSIFEKKNYGIILSSIFMILTSLAIFYSGSRGGYLGLFAIFVAIFVMVYKTTNGFENLRKRVKTFIVGFFVGLIAFITLTPSILKRIISIFSMRNDSSTSFRMNVYQASINMFLDNPIFGIGVGNKNFREIYGLYMKTGFDALGSYSTPLEIAVESGIFALVTFLGFLTLSIKKCFKIFNENVSQKQKIIAFSIFLMILGVMAHGLVDTIWFRPQIQFLFWTYIAILNKM